MQGNQTGTSPSHHTVLIIDDEEMIRDLARDILEMQGYSILCAEDGIEGIKLYQNNRDKIDCIILDLTMPRMSGRETYIKLKEIDCKAKIILSTGFGKDERAQEIVALGVHGIVQKPYRMEELIRVVQRMASAKEED